tara:strand:+ start:309 stop:1745 length:1437 start_codon:yes stop_codon:yes gene_type:complete
MAKSYTPFDPHEYDLRSAVISTQRNDHSIDITSSMVELIIYEHIERPYLTGSLTYTDTGRSIEIMDYQGTEILDIEFALFTSSPKVKKRFVVREVESIVPTTDTTDMVTLKLIDYDAYLNTLINVNKMYEGKPSEIIDTILRDSFDSGKKVLRAGDANQFSSFIDALDIATNPNADAANSVKQLSQELQSAFRYIVPNLNPLEAIEVIKRRTTGLTGTPFFCFASLADNDLRFYDLYSLLQEPPINIDDPFIYSTQLSQRAATTGAGLARQIRSLKNPKNGNTMQLVQNGDVGSRCEYVDTTHGLEFGFNYDLEKVLSNLLMTGSYPAADTRSRFKNKHISEMTAERISKIATANIYNNNVKNIHEESSSQKHSAKAISKSVRNLLGKSILEITVPGLHMMPQDGNKTLGRILTVVSVADAEQHNEVFDRKRSGDYMVYTAKHTLGPNNYSVAMDLVKIANYKGNTKIGSVISEGYNQ